MPKLDYKQAGVDIAAGEEAVQKMKPLVAKTFNQNVLSHLGGFGGLYRLDLKQWKAPVMVASTDGVGTKLIIARKAGVFNTVGQDLVNHCVNDIFVQGATPQFFLDYIGAGKVEPGNIAEIVSGFATACAENDCALIGGETAEMPGIYAPNDFDLCGTIVGLVEEDKIITGASVEAGDVVLGFTSTGLHTNGYSLARKIVFDTLGYKTNTHVPELGSTVADALLAVHRSYWPLLKDFNDPQNIHAMAHITGGGIEGNLKRSIPDGLCAEIHPDTWETPALFRFLADAGKIDTPEMFRAFNMGIGFIVVAPAAAAAKIEEATACIRIGMIETGSQKVRLCH